MVSLVTGKEPPVDLILSCAVLQRVKDLTCVECLQNVILMWRQADKKCDFVIDLHNAVPYHYIFVPYHDVAERSKQSIPGTH